MNELVSVIIPIYNAEDYIENCLNSIIKQTYSNIEIIAVDDGSQDRSFELCEKYAKHDSRIKMIKKENGGPSSARNRGLECATGKYIAFIDADDVVENNYISTLYKLINDDGADIASCGYDTTLGTKKVIAWHDFAKENYTFKSQIDTNIHYPYTVWSLLFKRTAIGDVRFDEKIFYLEDMKFVDEVFMRYNRIVRVPDILYHRIAHVDSLTEKRYDKEYFEKYYTLIQALEDMCNITKDCDWLFRERKVLLIKETAKMRALLKSKKICEKEKKYKLQICAKIAIREIDLKNVREAVILWMCVYTPCLYCKLKGVVFTTEEATII